MNTPTFIRLNNKLVNVNDISEVHYNEPCPGDPTAEDPEDRLDTVASIFLVLRTTTPNFNNDGQDYAGQTQKRMHFTGDLATAAWEVLNKFVSPWCKKG